MDKWTALRPCPLTHRPITTMRPPVQFTHLTGRILVKVKKSSDLPPTRGANLYHPPQ